MNPFQLHFHERLQAWYMLRHTISLDNLGECCHQIDAWWQRAPLVQHYLHPQDTQSWPDPWQLLSENEYCPVARGLGMCYTLHLVGVQNFELCESVDEYGDEYIIVGCDKYAMNWHPHSVLNTPLSKFTIKRPIDISHLLTRIK